MSSLAGRARRPADSYRVGRTAHRACTVVHTQYTAEHHSFRIANFNAIYHVQSLLLVFLLFSSCIASRLPIFILAAIAATCASRFSIAPAALRLTEIRRSRLRAPLRTRRAAQTDFSIRVDRDSHLAHSVSAAPSSGRFAERSARVRRRRPRSPLTHTVERSPIGPCVRLCARRTERCLCAAYPFLTMNL